MARITGDGPDAARRLRVCAVGDSMWNDVQGAAKEGYGSIFIADGIHAEALGVGEAAGEPVDPGALHAFLKVGGPEGSVCLSVCLCVCVCALDKRTVPWIGCALLRTHRATQHLPVCLPVCLYTTAKTKTGVRLRPDARAAALPVVTVLSSRGASHPRSE